MRRQMRSWPVVFATLLFAMSAGGRLRGEVFEQIVEGSRGAWRTRASGSETVILTDGFVVRRGETVRRFRWHESMQLETLAAEEPLSSNTYMLSGPEGKGRLLSHAGRVRARSRDGQVSVLYYFGARGLEFDLEAAPHAAHADLRLESIDGDFALASEGRASIEGEILALQPMAYSTAENGVRHSVSVYYKLEDSRHLVFEIGDYESAERLVVDPVLTYSSYFAGSGEDEPLAIRELPDGSILLAGNSASIDLPHGVSLNRVLTQPHELLSNGQCFVARLSPATKKIHFMSYFAGSDFTRCHAMDVDSSGRILLAGITAAYSALTTANAQYRNARHQSEGFLARISADGKTLEYSTYLGLDCHNSIVHMLAGPGETAYLGSTCSGMIPSVPDGYQQTPGEILLLRYDIAARQFDRKSYFGGGARLAGIALAPNGELYVFGSTSSPSFPLLNPLQSAPPLNVLAGFVGALSGDLRRLLYGTYVGGQGAHTHVGHVIPLPDGSLWLNGQAYKGSIPGLEPLEPDASGALLFAMQVAPGNPSPLKAILSGISSGARAGLLLPGNRYCLLTTATANLASPGGAAFGSAGFTNVPLLGCLNAAGNDFDFITPVGGFVQSGNSVVAPSRQGGVWSAFTHSRGGFGDAVPFELKAAALQPFRPNATPDTDDIILHHVDLATPRPVLNHPQPVRLFALQGNIVDSVDFNGSQFSLGMLLDIEGTQVPLQVTGPSTATLEYRSPAINASQSEVLGVRAGNYSGRLVIPTRPEPAVSDSFPVVVENLPPAVEPFLKTAAPRVFRLASPAYDDSEVRWNGQPVAHRPAEGADALEVEIPAALAQPGTGELALINRPPGGGEQRVRVTFTGNASTLTPPTPPPFTRVQADLFQVDRARRILYTLFSSFSAANEWNLTASSLPGGETIRTLVLPKGDAGTAASLQLSSDGRFLYLLDDLPRVTRFQADSFTKDLEFRMAPDAPKDSTAERRLDLMVLDDAPESFVIVTPAGRMILYDRDQQRPYTTTDFPSLGVQTMDPIVANSRFLYAVQRGDDQFESPCLVRYPVDGLGFAPADDLCNLSTEWGKYPEMKTYAGNWVLQDGASTVGLLRRPGFSGMRDYREYDLSKNVAVFAAVASFNFGNNRSTYRLLLRQMDSGEPLGHLPRQGAFDGFANTLVFVDEMLIYHELPSPNPPRVVIVPAWRAELQP